MAEGQGKSKGQKLAPVCHHFCIRIASGGYCGLRMITHEYASAAAVCRDFLVAPLKAKILYVDIMQDIFIVGMGR